MDIESLKKLRHAIDWKRWLKLGGEAILFLVGLAIALGILAAVFVGIPLAGIALLSIGYDYLTTREVRYYYAATFVLILLVVLLVFRRIGLVSLSSQSLAHRRNLFFSFFLVFLIENFNLDVAAMFKASNDQINAAAKGILALFALYSFIEYAHNFLFDYLRSKNNSRIVPNNSFLRFPKLVDPWLIFIGNYRFLFDVALPIVTSAFILMIYSKDIGIVFNIGKTYVSTEVGKFINDPSNVNLKAQLDATLVEYERARINVVSVLREAEDAVIDKYEKASEQLKESKQQ